MERCGGGERGHVSLRQFFTHVTNSVVLAVVASEVGEVEVETLLDMLTSWSVDALSTHMTVNLLTCGQLRLVDGGVAVYNEVEPPGGRLFLCEEQVWAVLKVEGVAAPKGGGAGCGEAGRGGGGGRQLHVYAALNVGREGWCVLTANFHTLIHVLRDHNMCTDKLTAQSQYEERDKFMRGQEQCVCEETNNCKEKATNCVNETICLKDNNCEQYATNNCRQEGKGDYLVVPRVRASQRQHPMRPFSFRWFMYRVKQARQMAYMMLVDSEEALRMVESQVHYYLSQSDPDSGWCLLAGFDVQTREHRAVGRHSLTQPALEVVRKEPEAREFLVGVRPLLKERETCNVNEFLRNFTRINPVRWDEALEIVCGEVSLREAAFHSVCHLPLSYLQQHAPSHLYTVVSHTHTLHWTPEPDLKTAQDVT
ncbi:hypothetical protein Pcinc_031492 [Petrolisthes cinctipes]|uniref:Uncharacterized protein n=1 Tax=Petrolisthes cinctipes TaxID=88211 RepID=A0AAE1EWK5_PETCI|nr:hypothetical protein Pcinc_031492 [Petrolisthes cinctipes]